MKSVWKIATLIIGVVLIFGAALTWHLVKTQIANRKLAEAAAATRVRAEQGDVKAESDLAHMYYHGIGVPQDYAEAARWNQKAADQGDAKGEYAIGYMHHQGQAVAKDEAEAMRWYQKSADHGDARAENVVARRNFYGQGVPQNYPEAARWYRKAADHGDAKAQYALGYMEYSGVGMPRDYCEAARLYRKAADQGDANAQFTLGFMYMEGQGVPKDHAEAARLYRAAAKQGNGYARRALNSMKLRFDTVDKVTMGVTFLFCLILLAQSRLRIRGRQHGMATLGGLLGLTYLGLVVYGHLYFGAILAITSVNAFYSVKGIVTGVGVSVLLSIVSTRYLKVLLWACGVMFIGFNIYALEYYHFSDCRAFYSFNAELIAMSISAFILLRLYANGTKSQNDNAASNFTAPSASA